MSLTSIAWLLLVIFLTIRAVFYRPVWGVILYLVIFFIFPPAWWWGKSIPSIRWSLFGGCILLFSLLLNKFRNRTTYKNSFQNIKANVSEIDLPVFINKPFIYALLFLMILNYLCVHFLITDNLDVSFPRFILALKFLFLLFLLPKALQTNNDIVMVLVTIMIALAYLGFQVYFDNTGYFFKGRLEGLPVPGARSANLFASILVLFLPCLGALFFTIDNKLIKFSVFLSLPFILNLLFLVNSRGAYLGVISAGLLLTFTARNQEKKIMLTAVACCFIAILFLGKNQAIYNRFGSIFVNQENRDHSAAGRLLLWRAGLEMISDYPLGAGGDGFRIQHGEKYTAKYGYNKLRSVHNGYLSIACEWGIQGLVLKLLLIFYIAKRCLSAAKYQLQNNNYKESFLAKALAFGLFGFLVSSTFSSLLDEEWLYWMLGFLLAFASIEEQKKIQLNANSLKS